MRAVMTFAQTGASPEPWVLAHQLALAVYRLTRSLPLEERFVVGTQLRRTAALVAVLAEAALRGAGAERAGYVAAARQALVEVREGLRRFGGAVAAPVWEMADRLAEALAAAGAAA